MDVQLGCRTAAQADAMAASGSNERHLPGIALTGRVRVTTAAEIELGGVDLVVLAVPSRALPGAVARTADRIGPRTAVLVLTKGVVAPLGTLPSRYVGDRIRARGVAALGGPAHAREMVESGASVVLACADPDLRRQLVEVLGRAGLDVTQTDDVQGAELAGCAKNLAALAAAAAAPRGMNLAGAAAGRVFGEIHDYAVEAGGRSETFAGLAGVGDLVATALAEGSRNRRAGELLGLGMRAEEAGTAVGQAAEALDSAPLLAAAMGPEARAVGALGALIEGRLTTDQWLADAAGARRAA